MFLGQMQLPSQVSLRHDIELFGHGLFVEQEILLQPSFQGSPSKTSGHLHLGPPVSMTHTALVLQ